MGGGWSYGRWVELVKMGEVMGGRWKYRDRKIKDV